MLLLNANVAEEVSRVTRIVRNKAEHGGTNWKLASSREARVRGYFVVPPGWLCLVGLFRSRP